MLYLRKMSPLFVEVQFRQTDSFIIGPLSGACMNSPLGRNVTFCSLRYDVSVNNLCILPLPNSLENVLVCVKFRICRV